MCERNVEPIWKWCPVCESHTENFGRNRARPDGLQAQCRGCLKAIQKVSRKRPEERERCRLNKLRQRRKLQAWLLAFLADRACLDCGESDPVVLEFDHRGEKTACIAELVRDAVALSTLEAEVAKCLVRCANCHRRKTAHERNAYRAVDQMGAHGPRGRLGSHEDRGAVAPV